MKRALLVLVVAAAALLAARWWMHRAGPAPTPPPDANPGVEVAAGPADAPPPRPGAVDLRGHEVRVELDDEPAVAYELAPARSIGALGEDDLPAGLLRAVREAGADPQARFDPQLTRAAHQVALLATRLAQMPPEAALEPVLHSAGAPEPAAAVYLTRAQADDDAPVADTLRRALAAAPPGHGEVRFGLGEAVDDDAEYPRAIAVLVTRRDYRVVEAATAVARGGVWRARVDLGPGWTELRAQALHPDGGLSDVELIRTGDRLELRVAAGAGAGRIAIGVDGHGPEGPGKLLQLSAWIGAPPRTHLLAVPPADPEPLDPAAGEQWAFQRLADDRARAGLGSLVLDADLSRLARRHSEEMRDRGFFAHRSPSTGLVGDRLRAAGLATITYGENLAKNDSLAEAQASLMGSVGHRANIVGPRFTHVGVGVARDSDKSWYLTQVFTRPAPVLGADAAAQLVARYDRTRAERGLPPLRWRPALAEFVAVEASAALTEPLAAVVERASRRASGVVTGRALISAHQVGELDEVAAPAPVLEQREVELGVALAQDRTSGRIGVVMVVVTVE
ncbi:MAG: hypothetical protein KA297_23305 [Kofleriaceae bacterium]|nr:hypothetical protein [Kofleriaceae bacterium]MBP6840290.1 hypothetical protein [Kofleriaceae bacterium]